MKRFVGSVLIVFFIIQTISAQNKSFNLNDEGVVSLKSLSIASHDSIPAFQNAHRARPLRFNPLIQDAQSIQLNDTILLDLFDNKHFRGVIQKMEQDANGTSVLRARLEGEQHGSCVISTFRGKSFMTIEVAGKNELYLSRFDHGTNRYFLLQMDPAKQKKVKNSPSLVPPADNQLDDDPSLQQNQQQMNAPPSKQNSLPNLYQEAQPLLERGANIQDTISVMIVYTPSAANWSRENETHINNTIAQIMAKSQLVLDNSNTFTTLHLVHTAQVNYTELNTSKDLDNLTGTKEGKMDQVHTWRNTYGADLVVLLEEIDFTGGIAWLLNSPSGSPTYAFSLTRVQQASWTSTTIHEIGHNLGCHHHLEQNEGAGPGLYSYSSGWRWVDNVGTTYCSVMTYEEGSYFDDGIEAIEVPYFSSPTVHYEGLPVGHAVQADNAHTIRQVKSVVASYRAKVPELPCTLPLAAGPLSGKTAACQGESSVLYSLTAIPNATSYRWTLPSGASGTSSTNSISVSFGQSAVSGNLTVKGVNDCGEGIPASLPISVNALPDSAVFIDLTTSVCQGSAPGIYTVHPISNAVYYLWTLPSGGTEISFTNSITVLNEMEAGSYNLTVRGVNDCGEGMAASLPITVHPVPAPAESISGRTNVCQGSAFGSYTVQPIANAVYYRWTHPSGATEISFSNSIVVPYDRFVVSGDLTVVGVNYCGEGMAVSLPITVHSLPAPAESISGRTNVCQGSAPEIYTVQPISNAIYYRWIFPSGATEISFTNSITVLNEMEAGSYNLTVSGVNDCGEGPAASLFLEVNPVPVTPVISLFQGGLISDAVMGNQWYGSNGLIPGAFSREFTPGSSGTYYVVVTSWHGCTSNTSNWLNYIPTSSHPVASAPSFSIYPNPATHELTIQRKGAADQSGYEIVNPLGQLVLSGTLTDQTVLQISSLSPGLYLVRLTSGEKGEWLKFLKQ